MCECILKILSLKSTMRQQSELDKTRIVCINTHVDSRTVSFPDFPGCVSAGSTLNEAEDMAQEAPALHINGMREDGEPIPGPSDFETLVSNPEYSCAIAFLVISMPDQKPKAIRVNVTIPEDTLKRIDTVARKKGLSRSSFLVQAAKSAMKKPARVPPEDTPS